MLAKTCSITLSNIEQSTPKKAAEKKRLHFNKRQKMLPHSFPQYSSQVTTSKCNTWWAEWQDLVVGVLSNMTFF